MKKTEQYVLNTQEINTLTPNPTDVLLPRALRKKSTLIS